MGRQHLLDTNCGVCDRKFDVATEDLEWEHLADCGETDEDSALHDYSISQEITCPYCKGSNKVMINFKGKSGGEIDLTTVSIVNFTSLEI